MLETPLFSVGYEIVIINPILICQSNSSENKDRVEIVHKIKKRRGWLVRCWVSPYNISGEKYLIKKLKKRR